MKKDIVLRKIFSGICVFLGLMMAVSALSHLENVAYFAALPLVVSGLFLWGANEPGPQLFYSYILLLILMIMSGLFFPQLFEYESVLKNPILLWSNIAFSVLGFLYVKKLEIKYSPLVGSSENSFRLTGWNEDELILDRSCKIEWKNVLAVITVKNTRPVELIPTGLFGYPFAQISDEVQLKLTDGRVFPISNLKLFYSMKKEKQLRGKKETRELRDAFFKACRSQAHILYEERDSSWKL